eukprot:5843914-Amphidinium_carterae.1
MPCFTCPGAEGLLLTEPPLHRSVPNHGDDLLLEKVKLAALYASSKGLYMNQDPSPQAHD